MEPNAFERENTSFDFACKNIITNDDASHAAEPGGRIGEDFPLGAFDIHLQNIDDFIGIATGKEIRERERLDRLADGLLGHPDRALFGGSIKMDSRAGQGTQTIILLPAVQSAEMVKTEPKRRTSSA